MRTSFIVCDVVAGLVLYNTTLHHWRGVIWASELFLSEGSRRRSASASACALAGFDPNGHAALQIQDFYHLVYQEIKNLAEAKKRAHDEKLAEKNQAAEEAKAKAEQEKLFQEAQAGSVWPRRTAAVAKAESSRRTCAKRCIHARQEDKALGPIKAKKNSQPPTVWTTSGCRGTPSSTSRHTVKSRDNRTFIYEDPPNKGASAATKSEVRAPQERDERRALRRVQAPDVEIQGGPQRIRVQL